MNNIAVNTTVVSCCGLKKSFIEGNSRVDVLNELDFSVREGEICAIIGNSGSGKSTLLHLLGGLDSPTEGIVKIKDKNLADLSDDEKCIMRNYYLGFVYQFHHLLPEFTALENVGMPLLIRGMMVAEIQAKAENLLEQVGLKHRKHHRPNQLSGGERQRVAIARALVTDPICLLVDEPTGDLDAYNAEQVFQLFINLQASLRMSVVMVTHDISLAKRAHRTLMLVGGKLVAFDPLSHSEHS